jgi:hypothetical protein
VIDPPDAWASVVLDLFMVIMSPHNDMITHPSLLWFGTVLRKEVNHRQEYSLKRFHTL